MTRLLTPGRNAIGAVLGDGWYRGRLGWDAADDRCRYGRELGLIAQLEIECVDGTRLVVVSDRSWRASTAEIRAADLYDGSTIDLRVAQPGWDAPGFDDSGWIAATSVPFDPGLIEQRSAPPVRRIAVLPVRLTRAGEGCWRLDGGQNISGWVRLTVRGARDDRVVVRHAEVLEPDGGLHTLRAPLREGDGRVRPRRRGPGRARAGVHVPRVPLRRGRDVGRDPRCAVRRDQQRHRTARVVRVLGSRT